jgi:phosphohistidine phosphatase
MHIPSLPQDNSEKTGLRDTRNCRGGWGKVRFISSRLFIIPMDLLILRHGRAEDRSEGVPDESRSLTKKGIRDIRRVARWMTASGVVPDRIVSSPLLRAKETAEIVAGRTGFPGEIAFWDELRPGAGVAGVVSRLGELEGASLPLLAGHEPLLSSLVGVLIGAGEGARIVLDKGGVARIGNLIPEPVWHGDLLCLLTVRQMRDMA